MKRTILALLGCLALVQARAADLPWTTDLPKALDQAKTEKKAVLLNFTGSDWCPWCIKFDKEVFSTSEFAQYAKDHLVLVLVDFPRKKELSAKLHEANKALQKKYEVDGFPTYVVLNAEGKEIGRQVGYEAGGPKAFVEKLDGYKKKT